MKAIYLTHYGESKDAFEIRETAIPQAGPGEVVIRVMASGLNFADVMARRGLYKAAPPCPAILGYDVSGTIHAIGPGVTGLEAGQPVAAMTRFGGYAEFAKTQAGAVIPLPLEMAPGLATALATQASTAVYSACFASRLYPGDRVLVHAAAGGVGTILVQLAKNRGCVVYGSASPHKHDYLREIGVDFPIDSLAADPMVELTKMIAGEKLDAVFDNLGGLSFKRGYGMLGPGGRIIAYGAAAQNRDSRPNRLNTIRVGLGFGFHSPIGLIVRSQSMIGVNMLSIADHKPVVLKEVMDEVSRLTLNGTIRPVIGKVFQAHEVADAHEYIESRQSVGKVALAW